MPPKTVPKTQTQTLLTGLKKVTFSEEVYEKRVSDLEKDVGNMKRDLSKLKRDSEQNGKSMKRVEEEIKGIKLDNLDFKKREIEREREEAGINKRLEAIEKSLVEMREILYRDFSAAGDESMSSRNAWSNSRAGSVNSLNSCGSAFSEREIAKIKKLTLDQDRKERSCNIVIRGARVSATDMKELKKWVYDFLKDRLEVEAEVSYAKMNGNVVVARLGSPEVKGMVMKNKMKLKGCDIFIENDLCYEDRKTQQQIASWVRDKKQAGLDIRMGQGAVKINGVWKKWQDIEREERNNMSRNANSDGEQVFEGTRSGV